MTFPTRSLAVLAIAAFGFAGQPLHAQHSASPAVVAAAQQYVALPAMQEMIDRMFAPESFAAQIGNNPDNKMNAKQLQELGTIIAAWIDEIRPDLERGMADAAARHYTVEELDAMTVFHSTEVGASVLRKTQYYFQDFSAFAAPIIRAGMMKLSPEINRIFQNP